MLDIRNSWFKTRVYKALKFYSIWGQILHAKRCLFSKIHYSPRSTKKITAKTVLVLIPLHPVLYIPFIPSFNLFLGHEIKIFFFLDIGTHTFTSFLLHKIMRWMKAGKEVFKAIIVLYGF